MVKKIILGCFLFSSVTLSAQMPASYGSSGGTSNINAEVISRVYLVRVMLATLFPGRQHLVVEVLILPTLTQLEIISYLVEATVIIPLEIIV